MRYSFLKTAILLFVVIVAVQLVDRYFFDRKIASSGLNLIKRPSSAIFAYLESSRFFLSGLLNIRNLVSENDSLRRDKTSLLSRLADYEDIKSENDFLRNALKVSPRFKKEIIYASVFTAQRGPDGYDVLLTKGKKDNVSDNDIVITEEGVLVGRVETVRENFSTMLIVTDSDFSITAKVLGSDTAGIVKGAMEKGLYFDLITQGDLIKEGDMIVSSGIDFFPPALVIGTVSHININEADLFKKVKIRPAIDEVKLGRVLVIKK